MKNKWHTGTLFFEHWKYRWSYKFDTCQKCKTVEFPHKWRWLCTSCWDKERGNNKNRKYTKKKAGVKFHIKSKLLKILETPVKSRKKREKTFDVKIYKREYYERKKPALKLLAKIDRRLKNWKACLKIMINWKERFFPFDWIERPSCMTSPDFPKYEEQRREFEILREYYNNLWKK